MLNALNDQASGLRGLMCLGQPIDSMTSISLGSLFSEIDGLGLASFEKKIEQHKIPILNLLDNASNAPSLDILNAKSIVLYINQSSESIKTAYSIVKLLSQSSTDRELGFLIQASSESKSLTIFHNIKMASNAFHHILPTYLGCLVSGNTYISAHNSDM
jgi:hypothetical protein